MHARTTRRDAVGVAPQAYHPGLHVSCTVTWHQHCCAEQLLERQLGVVARCRGAQGLASRCRHLCEAPAAGGGGPSPSLLTCPLRSLRSAMQRLSINLGFGAAGCTGKTCPHEGLWRSLLGGLAPFARCVTRSSAVAALFWVLGAPGSGCSCGPRLCGPVRHRWLTMEGEFPKVGCAGWMPGPGCTRAGSPVGAHAYAPATPAALATGPEGAAGGRWRVPGPRGGLARPAPLRRCAKPCQLLAPWGCPAAGL